MYFLDRARGVIVGDGGTALHTEDGGDTWLSEQTPLKMSFKSISASGGDMWVVGGNGAGIRWPDEVGSWVEMNMRVPNSNGMPEPIWSVDFTESGRGVAGAEFGVLIMTEDGGESWRPVQPRPTFARINDAAWLDDRALVAVGEFGTLLRSEDAGRSWETIWSHPDLFSIEFVDGQTGWAAGAAGTIYLTRDGGSNWTRQPINVPFQLFGLAAVSREAAFVVGDNRTFYETVDGREWGPIQDPRSETGSEERIHTDDTTELAMTSYAVEFAPDGKTGWLVGDLSKVIKTEDGGRTWTSYSKKAQDASLQTLHGLDVLSADAMFAVGQSGAAVKTLDGGESWTLMETGSFEELNDVEFAADEQSGWIVGSSGAVFVTTNGGGSWVQQVSNASGADLYALAVSSPSEAWIAGSGGTLLRTEDGGITWVRERAPTRSDMLGIAAAPDGRVWAAGRWGIVLVYE